MNLECQTKTNSKWINDIEWCRLEDIQMDHSRLRDTTIAFMYDLCLKRLSRRAKSETEDPHISIENILLDRNRMPSLRLFISTYEPSIMTKRFMHESRWTLLTQKKLACSTNSYMFYVYERCIT
jgi:hypothetical protein